MSNKLLEQACFYPPHEQCDCCGKCAAVEEYNISEFEEYEPSDADIEAELERQIAEAEAMADNL